MIRMSPSRWLWPRSVFLCQARLTIRCCSGAGLCLAETFGLHGEMHLVLKARIFPLGQYLGVLGDCVAEGFDPIALDFAKVAQHIRVDQLLCSRMANTDAHAAVIVADMRRDRAQSVVARI